MGSLARFPVYAVLPASDFERARAWYREKLELTPSEELPGNAWYRCADGTWFILTQTPNARTARTRRPGSR
ncbi:MAG TPA: VOC family protein [Actinomycetota bacterium]|nr:VOC family protein [Actinomycetota bacterium]